MSERAPIDRRAAADRLVRRTTRTVAVAATSAMALVVGWLGFSHEPTVVAAASSTSAKPTVTKTATTSTKRHLASATSTSVTTTTAQPVATSGGS
jgi:hypothetical protein